MSAKLRAAPSRGKKDSSQIGHQASQDGHHISPVMQVWLDSLKGEKPAEYLAYLTGHSREHCKKVVCGQRRENLDVVTALLRSDHGREVLFALMGDANPPWFAKYRSQLAAVEARQMAEAAMRAAEAATAEVFK